MRALARAAPPSAKTAAASAAGMADAQGQDLDSARPPPRCSSRGRPRPRRLMGSPSGMPLGGPAMMPERGRVEHVDLELPSGDPHGHRVRRPLRPESRRKRAAQSAASAQGPSSPSGAKTRSQRSRSGFEMTARRSAPAPRLRWRRARAAAVPVPVLPVALEVVDEDDVGVAEPQLVEGQVHARIVARRRLCAPAARGDIIEA